jgi:glycopeptide antibiotics resistance protein
MSRVPRPFRRVSVASARAAYIAIILLATVVQVLADPQLAGLLPRLRFALNPALGWGDAYDAVQNVLLFAGFGAVWLVTSPAGRLRDALLRATVVGAAVSLTVEALQLFSALRVASVADVTTNTLGSFLGALGAGVITAAVRSRRGHRTPLGLPYFVLALAGLGTVLAESLAPLDSAPTLQISARDPLQRVLFALRSATLQPWDRVACIELALCVPLGVSLALALREFGWRRAATLITSIAATGIAVALVELTHGLQLVPVQWEAVVARTSGIALGAMLALGGERRLRDFDALSHARAAVAITAGVILLWMWRPYDFRPTPAAMLHALDQAALIPLQGFPARSALYGVARVIQLASLGFALGALLCVWPVGTRGWRRYIWPAAPVAALAAAGQAAIEGRQVDVTNALLLFAGTWLGDAVLRRAGFRPYGSLTGGEIAAGTTTGSPAPAR